MLQFKIGDRVRISPFAPADGGLAGTIVQVQDRTAGALRLQECEIDLGTHSSAVLSLHLEDANTPLRLMRGEMLSTWKHLAPSDLEQVGGDHRRLIDLLQTKYGYAPGRAEKEVRLFFANFRDRLRRAA